MRVYTGAVASPTKYAGPPRLYIPEQGHNFPTLRSEAHDDRDAAPSAEIIALLTQCGLVRRPGKEDARV